MPSGESINRYNQSNKVVGIPVSFGIDQFKDRIDEREKLGRFLSAPNTRLVSITGRRGIGKSALAARVLRGLEYDRWPHTDERIHVSGLVYEGARRRGISVERIYFDLASLFEETETTRLAQSWSSLSSIESRVSALFDATAGGLYIILLDNFEDELTDDGQLQNEELVVFFDILFRASTHPRVLITSQLPIKFDPRLRRFNLMIELTEGLPLDEAVEFLRESDPNDELHLRSLPDADLRYAVEKLHGVPRALELYVGGLYDYLLLPTPADLLTEFATRADVVSELAHDRYWRLNPEQRLVMKVMALFGCPVSEDAISFALEPFASHLDVHPVLAWLAKIRLIGVDRRAKLWDLHPMDADLAYAELRGSNYKLYLDLHRRAADWYRIRHRNRSEWKTPDDLSSHRREFHHRVCATDHDDACMILAEVWQFLIWSGPVSVVRAMCKTLEGRVQDDSLELHFAVARAFVNLIGGPERDNLDLLEPKLARYRELGDSELSGKAYFVLGDLYYRSRRLQEGIQLLEEAERLFYSLDNHEWRFHSMLILGLAYASAGRTDEARSLCATLEQILRTSDAGPGGHARHLNLRQMVELTEGLWQEAFDTGQEALDRYAEAGIREAVGYIKNGLGLAMVGSGNLEDAIQWFEQGNLEGVQIENPRVQGICLYNLSCTHMLLHDYTNAELAGQEAVESFRRQGSVEERVAITLLHSVSALLSDDLVQGGMDLRELVRHSVGNVDLCMASILSALATRLIDSQLA